MMNSKKGKDLNSLDLKEFVGDILNEVTKKNTEQYDIINNKLDNIGEKMESINDRLFNVSKKINKL